MNLLILFIIHLDNKQINKFLKTDYFYKTFFVLIFYIVVRSNIITSIHSFSVSLNLQKYFYIYFIFLLCLIFYLFLIVNYKNNIYKNIIKYNTKIIKFLKINQIFLKINFIIVIITLINIFIFFINRKTNINVYKYVSIFLKISLFNFYFFFKKNKINNFLLLLLFLNDLILIFLTMFYFFYKKLNIVRKTFHLTLVLIIFFLLDSCDLFIKNNLNFLENYFYSIYVEIYQLNINEFLLNLNYKINKIGYYFNNNIFLLKSNFNFFSENCINNNIQSGFMFNFFNSNIINLNNMFYLNYIVDGNFFLKFDLFLKNNLNLLFILFIIYIKNNVKSFFLKNGIV